MKISYIVPCLSNKALDLLPSSGDGSFSCHLLLSPWLLFQIFLLCRSRSAPFSPVFVSIDSNEDLHKGLGHFTQDLKPLEVLGLASSSIGLAPCSQMLCLHYAQPLGYWWWTVDWLLPFFPPPSSWSRVMPLKLLHFKLSLCWFSGLSSCTFFCQLRVVSDLMIFHPCFGDFMHMTACHCR